MTQILWFQNAKKKNFLIIIKIKDPKGKPFACRAHKCMLLPPINRTNRCYLPGPQHICPDKAATLASPGKEVICMFALWRAHFHTFFPDSTEMAMYRGYTFGCIFQVHLQSLCLRNIPIRNKKFF